MIAGPAHDLGRFAEGFMCFRRVLASVDQPNRWLVFQNIVAETANYYVAKGLDRTVAADELTDIAEAYSLMEAYGVDEVQRVIASAFAHVEPDRVPPLGDFEDPAWVRDEQSKGNGHGNSENEPPPLPYVDLALDLVPRQWLVPDRVPMRNVTGISGEGSIGKSLLLMQLSGAVVLGGFWIGTRPQTGPVLYMSCEEDDDEVRRRAEDVARNLGSTRKKMIEHGLRILSFAGKDAILAQPDRNGIIRPTPLFEHIRRDALQLSPKLIVLDTVADTFGGKEIDRGQTRQFITLQRSLAIECDAAVIMSSHPSLTGINSDSGLSGSTGWHNSVRARLYLKRAPGDDTTLRALEIKKNNYGPVTETVLLRWRDGVYEAEGVGVPEEQAERVLERLAAEAQANTLFLTLLRRFASQGRNVTDKPGTSYAPAMFAKEPEAKKAKVSKEALAEAMTRLFADGKIEVAFKGSKSRERSRIVEIEPSTAPSTTPSTTPSTALPPPSTDPATPPPHTPPPEVEWARGSVEAAPSTSGLPREGPAYRPRTKDGYEVIGAEPDGTACVQCGNCDGTVYLVRDPFKGVRSEPLHEDCAALWYKRRPEERVSVPLDVPLPRPSTRSASKDGG